jgi:hypothetical protein
LLKRKQKEERRVAAAAAKEAREKEKEGCRESGTSAQEGGKGSCSHPESSTNISERQEKGFTKG